MSILLFTRFCFEMPFLFMHFCLSIGVVQDILSLNYKEHKGQDKNGRTRSAVHHIMVSVINIGPMNYHPSPAPQWRILSPLI